MKNKKNEKRAVAAQRDHTASTAPLQVRVVSYNVLSERLCHKNEYIHCSSGNLEASRRHTRIEYKLTAEVRNKSIIVLQEVTVAFASRLTCFFERNGYHFVHDPYSTRRSGWMGVAIAYPRAVYSLSSLLVEEPTDARWIWDTVSQPHSRESSERSVCHAATRLSARPVLTLSSSRSRTDPHLSDPYHAPFPRRFTGIRSRRTPRGHHQQQPSRWQRRIPRCKAAATAQAVRGRQASALASAVLG